MNITKAIDHAISYLKQQGLPVKTCEPNLAKETGIELVKD